MQKTNTNTSPFKIHVIGDSHVSFFSGTNTIGPEWPGLSKSVLPLFEVYRLGPTIAYNLCKTGTRTKGREKLFEVLDTLEKGSYVMPVFGEIDCRVHLIKNAEENNKEEVVKECVERYVTVIDEIIAKGFNVIMWEVIPSTLNGSIVEKDYVAYGTCKQRNEITKIFNSVLRDEMRERNIVTLSVFDELTDKQGLTKVRWYADKIHLSQRVMPLVIRKIVNIFKKKKIQIFSSPISRLPFGVQMVLLRVISEIRTLGTRSKRGKNVAKAYVYKKIRT